MKNKNIELKNISLKLCPENDYFFKNINLSLPTKNIHYIKGKNGSGKSTFLRMLTGQHEYARPDKQININEQISLVSQDFNQMLSLPFSANQNIMFAKMKRYPKLKKLIQNSLTKLMTEFDIPLNIPMYRLSGGQRQIVAISMMLQNKTDILMLDEPTSALDETNSKLVFKFLEKLIKKEAITIFVVCHQNEHIKNYDNGYCINIIKKNDQYTRIVEQGKMS